jgi:hypothetical protein
MSTSEQIITRNKQTNDKQIKKYKINKEINNHTPNTMSKLTISLFYIPIERKAVRALSNSKKLFRPLLGESFTSKMSEK